MNLDDTIARIYPLISACAYGSKAREYWEVQLRDFQQKSADEFEKRLNANRSFNFEEYKRDMARLEELLRKHSIK